LSHPPSLPDNPDESDTLLPPRSEQAGPAGPASGFDGDTGLVRSGNAVLPGPGVVGFHAGTAAFFTATAFDAGAFDTGGFFSGATAPTGFG
jgi:hypothetical protein